MTPEPFATVLSSVKRRVGLACISFVGLLVLGLSLVPAEDPYLPKGTPPPPVEWSSLLMSLVIALGMIFLPAFLIVQGHSRRSRGLRVVGKIWLILEGAFWLGLCFLHYKNGGRFEWVAFYLGAPLVIGAILLGSDGGRPPERKPAGAR